MLPANPGIGKWIGQLLGMEGQKVWNADDDDDELLAAVSDYLCSVGICTNVPGKYSTQFVNQASVAAVQLNQCSDFIPFGYNIL